MPPETRTSPAVLAPEGDLDLASARGLGTELNELAGVPGDAVLDLSGVTFMDSVGLSVVLKAVSRFHRQDKRLVLVVRAESNVDRLLDASGMRGRLAVVRERDAALALCAPAR
jgi:anti-anti-sigma factor